MKHLMLALLVTTFSLSASADTLRKIAAEDAARTTTVKSSKSNSSDREASPLSDADADPGPRPGSNARGKPSKDQAAREPAVQGVDTCEFAIDQRGVKRLAQPQKECKTFNESRPNNARGAAPESRSGEPGIAVSDPGVPNKSTSKK